MPEIVDARIIGPLGGLLDDYFAAITHTLLEPAAGLSKEQNDIRSAMRIEALFVRGEGFQHSFAARQKWTTSALDR